MASPLSNAARLFARIFRNPPPQPCCRHCPHCQSALRTLALPDCAANVAGLLLYPANTRCAACGASILPPMKPIAITDAAVKRFRDAASQFTREISSRASRLLLVKDDIAALRSKGASFRAISELLKRNGIAASDTCVMRFCHHALGEQPTRSAKRKPVAAPKAATAAKSKTAPPAPMTDAAHAALLDGLLSAVPSNLSSQPDPENGPRIARIQFAKPGEL